MTADILTEEPGVIVDKTFRIDRVQFTQGPEWLTPLSSPRESCALADHDYRCTGDSRSIFCRKCGTSHRLPEAP